METKTKGEKIFIETPAETDNSEIKSMRRDVLPNFILSIDYSTKRSLENAVHARLKENYKLISKKLREDLKNDTGFIKSWNEINKVYSESMLDRFQKDIAENPISYAALNKFFGGLYANKRQESKQISEVITMDIMEGIDAGRLRSKSIDILPAFVYYLTDWGITWVQNIEDELEGINMTPISALLIKSRTDLALATTDSKKLKVMEQILFVLYSLIFITFIEKSVKRNEDHLDAYG